MQRLLSVVVLGVVLTELPILVLSDTDTPAAEAAIPRNEVANNTSETGNSSASSTLAITMYTEDDL